MTELVAPKCICDDCIGKLCATWAASCRARLHQGCYTEVGYLSQEQHSHNVNIPIRCACVLQARCSIIFIMVDKLHHILIRILTLLLTAPDCIFANSHNPQYWPPSGSAARIRFSAERFFRRQIATMNLHAVKNAEDLADIPKAWYLSFHRACLVRLLLTRMRFYVLRL